MAYLPVRAEHGSDVEIAVRIYNGKEAGQAAAQRHLLYLYAVGEGLAHNLIGLDVVDVYHLLVSVQKREKERERKKEIGREK